MVQWYTLIRENMPRTTSQNPPKKSASSPYQNNPFFVAADGVSLVARMAGGVALFLALLSLFAVFSDAVDRGASNADPDNLSSLTMQWSVSDWILGIGSVVVIGLAVIMILALLGGVSAYTSYRASQHKHTSIKDAFKVSFDHLWAFLWLQIIINVKILLWALLFIIPGIIMAYRYSLAGLAFFDERKKLRGNNAIKESLRLTNGAWITTFASKSLLNLLTLGGLQFLIETSANAVLYRQFDAIGDKPKPEAHWLSWITLVIPIAISLVALILFFGFIIGIILSQLQ